MISIAIIDDHRLFADSLKNILSQNELFYKIDVYYSLSVLKEAYHKLPSIILLDIFMGDENSLLFLKEKGNELAQKISIIMLSSEYDLPIVKQAFSLGVKGFLAKNCNAEELILAIKTVYEGKTYLGKSVKESIAESTMDLESTTPYLTVKESLVLDYLCASYTVKEISSEMNLSVHTIQMYVKNLLRKFNCNRTTDVILLAVKNQLNNPIIKKTDQI